jgi:ABC-type polysaccharide/polyol phosphate export permease
MIDQIKEIFKYLYLIFIMVTLGLKLRYSRSVLGYLWSLLAPMFYFVTIGIVFNSIMKSNIPNYFFFMLSGSIFYNFLSMVINSSTNTMLVNENFIKKIYMPKLVFILSNVLSESVNFLLSLISLFVLTIITGSITFSFQTLFIIIPIILSFFFLVGISCILSVITVFFRDLMHIVPVITQAFFFVTPIFYEIKSMGAISKYMLFNPFYYFIEIFRKPLYNNQYPLLFDVVICTIISFSLFILGLYLLRKFENKIVFKL